MVVLGPVILPKVNTRPGQPEIVEVADHDDEVLPSPGKLRRGEWDIRFAAGLILLVVLVNAGLAWLLSGNDSGTSVSSRPVQKSGMVEIAPPGDAVSSESPARRTRVYVSPDDRRQLLRRLNAPAEGAGEDKDSQVEPRDSSGRTGEFRSLRDSRALSVTGAGTR